MIFVLDARSLCAAAAEAMVGRVGGPEVARRGVEVTEKQMVCF
jgi:hypothetical protein